MPKNDEDWMLEYQNGSLEAFHSLHEKYSKRVYGYLRKKIPPEQAQDLYQEVFLRLHEKKHLFRTGEKFAPWLFTIAHHLLVDFYRREKPAEEIAKQHLVSSTSDTESWEQQQYLEVQLKGLKAEDRGILEMRFLGELEYEEIAQRLGLKESSVRKRISRTLQRLQLIGVKNGNQ